MKSYILKYSFVFLSVLALSVSFDLKIKFDDIKDYLTNLLVVSTMVFTLMAIWIAYLYPEALDKIKDQESNVEHVDFTETQAKLKRLEFIVASVFKSAIVAILILGIFLVKAIVGSTIILASTIPFFVTIAPSVLIVTFFLQCEAIYSVIKANIIFINELHGRKEKVEEEDDI